jgi:hypothetical protein
MRCSCVACQIETALELLRAGRRTSMAVLLLEQALRNVREQAVRDNTRPAKAPANARKARARG